MYNLTSCVQKHPKTKRATSPSGDPHRFDSVEGYLGGQSAAPAAKQLPRPGTSHRKNGFDHQNQLYPTLVFQVPSDTWKTSKSRRCRGWSSTPNATAAIFVHKWPLETWRRLGRENPQERNQQLKWQRFKKRQIIMIWNKKQYLIIIYWFSSCSIYFFYRNIAWSHPRKLEIGLPPLGRSNFESKDRKGDLFDRLRLFQRCGKHLAFLPVPVDGEGSLGTGTTKIGLLMTFGLFSWFFRLRSQVRDLPSKDFAETFLEAAKCIDRVMVMFGASFPLTEIPFRQGLTDWSWDPWHLRWWCRRKNVVWILTPGGTRKTWQKHKAQMTHIYETMKLSLPKLIIKLIIRSGSASNFGFQIQRPSPLH